MTVGENIKHYRRRAKLTQQELAEKLNITHGAISLWETDKRSMNVKQADKLAQALGVTLNDLMREE